MADIRRQVGDVTPNTFIRSGVQDNSAATIVGGLAEAGMALDTGLAKERFNAAQAQLNAQYVVGSPAAGTQLEDSASDTVPLSPADDRSLKDFKAVLDTQNGARDQGKMNFSSYQLRAERMLRIAIAKRPGLASEFRNIASSYVGSDVTGAESQYLANQEAEMSKAAAKSADKAEQNKWKLYNDKIELYKSVNMAGYAQFNGPDDPGFQEWEKQNMPIMVQNLRAKGNLDTAKMVVDMADTTREANKDANTELWVANAEVNMGKAAGLGDNIRTMLKQAGADKDPAAIRAAYEQAAEGVRATLAQQEVDASKLGVDSAISGLYRERGEALLKRLEGVITGANDKEIIEGHNDLLMAIERAGSLSNPQYLRQVTLMKDLPPALQERLTVKMEKTFVLTAAEMLSDTAIPESVARQAPDMLPQLITAIFPNGSVSASDPIAVARFNDLAVRAVASYITQEDSAFRSPTFSADVQTGKAGTLKVLDNHSNVIAKQLNPQQRAELSGTVAAAVGHSFVLLKRNMLKKYPGLQGKVVTDPELANGAVFKLKPGITLESLSVHDRAGLAAHNRSAQVPLALSVITKYGALAGSKEARELIWSNFAQGQALRAASKPQEARPATGSRGSSGLKGGSNKGPSTAWWSQ